LETGKGQETACTGKEISDEGHSGQGGCKWLYTDLKQQMKTEISRCRERLELNLLAQMLLEPAGPRQD